MLNTRRYNSKLLELVIVKLSSQHKISGECFDNV